MARIRTIKPDFWQGENLSSLSLEAHFLAAALLNYADDFGYFNANPRLIAANCCPLRDDVSTNIRRALDELSSVGYLRLAEGVDGKLYGWVVNFADHQKVDRPSASKIRPLADFDEPSTSTRRALVAGTGNREQGNGNIPPTPQGEIASRSVKNSSDDLARFSEFWSAYPRKVSKATAEVSWRKIRPDAELFALIMAGLDRAKASRDWLKDGGQFIPHPSTWLNQRRWEDVYEPPLPIGAPGSTGGLTQAELDAAAQLRWEYENGADPYAQHV